jgi:PIN domain nuclease of toxin-antitoxin system
LEPALRIARAAAWPCSGEARARAQVKPELPLLLYTHVWLWMAHGGQVPLRPNTVRAIERAGVQNSLRVSVISVWEIALLESKPRLEFPMGVSEWIARALERPELELIDLDRDVAIESCRLPGAVHADPADRFLIATARLRGLTIVTRDARILKYARNGHVQAMAA